MRKIVSVLLLFVMVFSLTSCEKGVTYLKFYEAGDADMFSSLTEVDVGGEDEVVFYTYETINNVTVNSMNYDYDNDEYSVAKTVYDENYIDRNGALKINLDLSNDVPYVMIRYTRANGETREQYIYYGAENNKLWLLERE